MFRAKQADRKVGGTSGMQAESPVASGVLDGGAGGAGGTWCAPSDVISVSAKSLCRGRARGGPALG